VSLATEAICIRMQSKQGFTRQREPPTAAILKGQIGAGAGVADFAVGTFSLNQLPAELNEALIFYLTFPSHTFVLYGDINSLEYNPITGAVRKQITAKCAVSAESTRSAEFALSVH